MADEVTTQATEVTTTPEAAPASEEWLIDVSDLAENEVKADEPSEEIEREAEAAPKADEADPQNQTESEADTKETKTEDAKETDQFTLKHLDEVKTVSRNEVIALAQKGMDYDRIRAKVDELTTAKSAIEAEKAVLDKRLEVLGDVARESGYSNVDDLLDSTLAERIATKNGTDASYELNKLRLDRREKELADKEAKLLAEKNAKTTESDIAKKAEEKRGKDFDDFAKSKYGNLKPDEIPKEVWTLYGDGQQGHTLLQAFTEVRTAKLEEEIAAQKKNTDNAKRSTGSIATPSSTTTKKDPFLEGWGT